MSNTVTYQVNLKVVGDDVISTSERNVTVLENGEKQVKFNFVKFRNY